MRDLDRIREVSEYRVTGPQLASLLGLTALLAGAAFLAGYQTGLWRGPLDTELLLPTAEEDTRQAGEALAGLLARRDAPTMASMAAPVLTTVHADEPVADEPEVSLVSTAFAATPEPEEQLAPLVASDDTKPDSPPETSAEVDQIEPDPIEVGPIAVESTPAEPEPPSTSIEDSLAATGAPAGRGWTVQVASYEEASEALALIRMLRGSGLEAFHQSAEVKGTVWHRVRVGLHSSKDAAEKSAIRLAGKVPFPPYVSPQP
jgi:cell division septation protein DedD